MHFYCYLRAIISDERALISDWQAQYFNFTFTDPKTKQLVNGAVQLGVRNWGGFYELVFPEACYDEFMAMIGRLDEYTNEGIASTMSLFALRKLLKCQKVKPAKEGTLPRVTWRFTHPDIRLIPIGIRKDEYKDGVEQL